jgi:large subunit ribosomal protein L1
MTKRRRAIMEKVDRQKAYPINDAVALLNELATAKFKESLDVAVNLGVDPRKSDQVVRGATTLPHGTGKTRRKQAPTSSGSMTWPTASRAARWISTW